MHDAVNYRLRPGEVDHDRALLDEACRELATLAPDWIACETFQLDHDGSMISLIDVDRIECLDRAPRRAAYLTSLGQRCEGEPRAGRVDRPSIDITDTVEVGLWGPERPTHELLDNGASQHRQPSKLMIRAFPNTQTSADTATARWRVGTIDPTAADEPRDRINYAIGILSARWDLITSDALKLLATWSSDTGITLRDLADLLIAEARTGGCHGSR